MESLISGYSIIEEEVSSRKNVRILDGIRHVDKKSILIKLLRNENPTLEEIERLKNEYEIMRIFDDHDDIAHAFEFEKIQHTYAIILEKVDAPSLAEILQEEKKFSIEEFLELAIKITRGIRDIHQHRVIHKDINPANILYNRESKKIKIIDFSLSSRLSAERTSTTTPNVITGTLPYLSPEQTGRMNRSIDYRSDFYSLGATFYHLIVGHPPFKTQEPMEMIYSHIALLPVPPNEVDPQIPESISSIIMKLLSKTAEERYQSATGLLSDLETCLKQWKSKKHITPFPLGKHDVFNTFHMPEKLYGRDLEINTLLKTYEKAASGKTELILVEGFAGIGKSSLVHELYKPITQRNGYFVSGKFDQFKHHIPYAALIQALNEWVAKVLTENESVIAEYKSRILAAVKENGQILIDVIPALTNIIGEQPPVPKLEPTENQNRFHYVFQSFISTLSTADSPLVIFLDDLQWADFPSLSMLETLMTNPDCKYLLIIGAYRSNEIDKAHPLSSVLDRLNKRQIIYASITLGPLELKYVEQLLGDMVHQEKNEVRELAEVCYEKTNGNPFFLVQLLKTLYLSRLIVFNPQKNHWTWDLEKIRTTSMTDNVVDLMITRIRQLKEEAQRTLELASCIGNRFSLDLLSHVSDAPVESLFLDLQKLMEEGLIVSAGHRQDAAIYQFAHDRIQQAAHSLIDNEQRYQIHLKLARYLLKSTPKEKLNDVIFDIINHYNFSIDANMLAGIEKEEKDTIARLNLQASRLAKTASAYEPALKYIEYSLSCIEESAWQSDYELTLEMHTEAAEAAYLSGKHKLMEFYANILSQHVKNIYDEIKVIQIKVFSFSAQEKHKEALDEIIKALARLGTKLPRHPNKLQILLAIMKVKFSLYKRSWSGKDIASLVELPEMRDYTTRIVINLLKTSYSPAYLGEPDLFPILVCEAIMLSLKYGNAKDSSYPYICFGMVSCDILKDIETGYQLGEMAAQLREKMHDEETLTKLNLVLYGFIKPWKDPIHSILPRLLENYEKGFETGDLEYGCYSAYIYIAYSFYSGIPLKSLLPKIESYRVRFGNLNLTQSIQFLSMTYNGILPFIEKREDVFPDLSHIKDLSILFNTYCFRLMSSYFLANYEDAVKCIEYARQYSHIVSWQGVPVFHFYQCMTFLALYPSSSKAEKKHMLKIIKASQKKLQFWANHAPENFLHKYMLVKAEIKSKVNNDLTGAIKYYNQAISLAQKSEFLHEEGLANELAGKFYLTIGSENIAKMYISEANYCYMVWGADYKLEQMKEQYGSLLAEDTLGVETIPEGTTIIPSSDELGSEHLDIKTIQKFSQAISSTVILKDLLKNLMNIVIENAGAQKGYLLLNKDGRYFIEAEANMEQKVINILKSIEMSSKRLPLSMINYVIKTKESLVLDRADRQERYNNDPYVIEKQLKSVLCMPLLDKNIMVGILYLENNLVAGAFTKDRIATLNLITSQAAISIENAKLYTQAKELNQQLIALNKSYERFVPYDFLTLLGKKSITDVVLGEQLQEVMTVLFADIRNFTSLSEKMSPQENFNFINSFLSIMSPIIKKHNGYVDKYIGDAIMAIFPNSPDDALASALEMQATLKQYREEHPDEAQIRIGVGINTGPVMFGTIGEKNRMNVTVISDAVNLAYRVESITKEYHVETLITEFTYQKLKHPDKYNIEMVANDVLVKGKSKTVAVYKVSPKLDEIKGRTHTLAEGSSYKSDRKHSSH